MYDQQPLFNELKMKSYQTILIETRGERFYEITKMVLEQIKEMNPDRMNGVAHLFIAHTSCALSITEAYDPDAVSDVQKFLEHTAPRNLPFIKHTTEGEDDSPSHMKSAMLQQNLAFIVEKGEILLGQWQGIFLAEFRDAPKQRKVYIKFQKD